MRLEPIPPLIVAGTRVVSRVALVLSPVAFAANRYELAFASAFAATCVMLVERVVVSYFRARAESVLTFRAIRAVLGGNVLDVSSDAQDDHFAWRFWSKRAARGGLLVPFAIGDAVACVFVVILLFL